MATTQLHVVNRGDEWFAMDRAMEIVLNMECSPLRVTFPPYYPVELTLAYGMVNDVHAFRSSNEDDDVVTVTWSVW